MVFYRLKIDWLLLILLVVVVVGYGTFLVDFNVPPFEDAAMLMRYADHLAHGYGIVWNVGERPVDGATDFLFMAATSALIKVGIPIGRSVRILGYGAHLITVLLVYWVNRKLWKAGTLLSLVSALYLALGSGLWYVAAFFGTTFFAFFAALTWTLSLLIIRREQTSGWLCILFSLSGLVTGLVRPEGVALAVFMMLAIFVSKGWNRSRRIVKIFAVVMLTLGGIYFLWHWSYFGYPLPNPYYKKGAGILHWDSFWESLGNLVRFGGPFLLAFLLGFRSRITARQTVAFMIPMLLFAATFILISNETNFGGRFQYAVWPLILLSYYPLMEGIKQEVGFKWPPTSQMPSRLIWGLVAASLIYGTVRYAMLQSCSLTAAQQRCGVAYEADGRYDLAKSLAEYKGKGYVLATTEAGLLPLYSTWTSLDAWGLNDAWIAHNGEITPAYLDLYKPELIVFHAYFSPLVPPRINTKNLSQDWFRMTLTLKEYAESRDYAFAAAFGDSPYEAHYYYVRRDFPDSEKIFQTIFKMQDYYWYSSGKKAINYAKLGK